MKNSSSIFWENFCISHMDKFCDRYKKNCSVHEPMFNSKHFRNSILQIAVDNCKFEFIENLLDYLNVPSGNLTLKERLSLYLLTSKIE